MLDLVFQNQTADLRHTKGFGEASKKYTSKFFEKILIAGIKELKLSKKSIEVSVNLVRGSKIRELNRKYRNKNKVTDVLSFPMDQKSFKKSHTTYPILHTTDFGDIFICLSFAKREAKSENVSIESKLAQLAVHGFLHLLGYDHEREKRDANIMFKLEKIILSKLSFK